MCVCVLKEIGRALHSVVLEFQLTLVKVGGPGVADPCARPKAYGKVQLNIYR